MQPLLLVAALGLLSLAACVPVPPPPVCAQPEVLQLLSERLRQAGRGTLIEPGSMNERPGTRPDLVECAARVQAVTYDPSPAGPVPVITVRIVPYAVELRKNGVFLLPEQTPQAGVARRSM